MDTIISIGGGGIFEKCMTDLSISKYIVYSRRTGFNLQKSSTIDQILAGFEDRDTTIFFTVDDYFGKGDISDFNSRELSQKLDLMVGNLYTMYQSLVLRKAHYKIVTFRGSPQSNKIPEISVYSLINRLTLQLIETINIHQTSVDMYYIEIGVFSDSPTGRIFNQITSNKYQQYEVSSDVMVQTVEKIIHNQLPCGYYRIDDFKL
jgi:hypothetical protein